MIVKLSANLWTLKQKLKFMSQKTVLEGYAKQIFIKQVLYKAFSHDNTWNFNKILNIKEKLCGLIQTYGFFSFLTDYN